MSGDTEGGATHDDRPVSRMFGEAGGDAGGVAVHLDDAALLSDNGGARVDANAHGGLRDPGVCGAFHEGVDGRPDGHAAAEGSAGVMLVRDRVSEIPIQRSVGVGPRGAAESPDLLLPDGAGLFPLSLLHISQPPRPD